MKDAKIVNVLDRTPEELRKDFADKGFELYRAGQVLQWVYEKGIYDFGKMTNLPAALREKIKDEFAIVIPAVVESKHSEGDNSTKLLLKLNEKDYVEAVYMPAKKPRRIRPQGFGTGSPKPGGEPMKTRETVCVSSQVGCKFHCAFCASGQDGFMRNLTMGEIMAQVLMARDLSPEKRLTNVVFMGIGEPFDNYKEMMRTVRTLNSPGAFGLAARRITISTCGVVPKIEQLTKEGLQVELSISLHGPNDIVRGAIMPVNNAYPVKKLIEACKAYSANTKRLITFEYILISGVNASLKEAGELGRLLKGMLCKVNLIPYNPIEEFPHDQPSYEDIKRFQHILQRHGVKTTVRFSKGRDIQAACGQLRSVRSKVR